MIYRTTGRVLSIATSCTGLYCMAHQYWAVMTLAFLLCLWIQLLRWLYKA